LEEEEEEEEVVVPRIEAKHKEKVENIDADDTDSSDSDDDDESSESQRYAIICHLLYVVNSLNFVARMMKPQS